MARTRALRWTLQLKYRGKGLIGRPRTRWFIMYWKTSRRGKELERNKKERLREER
jgi:hypothetical protein